MVRILMGLLLAAAANAAANAAAGTHTVEVRVSDGTNVYAKALKAAEGEQVSFAGRVEAGGGAPARMMLANVLLNRGEGFELQYQVELSGGKDSPDPYVQVQGAAGIRPGKVLTALECGTWAVALSLDRAGNKKKAADWKDAGAGNYRVTAAVSKSGVRGKVCRQVCAGNTQNNAVDGLTPGGRKLGFILNTLLTPLPGRNGGLNLQYQVDNTTGESGESFQLQGDAAATPGRKFKVKSGGYLVEFLVESAESYPVPAPTPAGVKPARGPAKKAGTASGP